MLARCGGSGEVAGAEVAAGGSGRDGAEEGPDVIGENVQLLFGAGVHLNERRYGHYQVLK